MNGTIKETITELLKRDKTFIDYKEAMKIVSQYDNDLSYITDSDKKELLKCVFVSKELSLKVSRL